MNILNRPKYLLVDTCSEMIEGVGHEFMDDFFGCCESLLAKDGLFVLQVRANNWFDSVFEMNLLHYSLYVYMQFISIPEERYEEYRRSSDFIKEYIFPGGCLPSLARITSAMSAASRLWYDIHIYNLFIYRNSSTIWMLWISYLRNLEMNHIRCCWRAVSSRSRTSGTITTRHWYDGGITSWPTKSEAPCILSMLNEMSINL